jgi:hypothetical protein
MGLTLPDAYGVETTSMALNVFTDVKSSGDLHADVSNVTQNIYVSGDNPELSSRGRGQWIKDLCDQLAKFLKVSHMMVVVNHGSAKDQDEFWRYMWQGGLENLVRAGLLLAHMVDDSNGAVVIHDLAPTANLEIYLPTALSASAREHAIEDLTRILVREVAAISAVEARVRADTLVRTHVEDIPRLHRQYSALLMHLGRQTG